MKTSTRVIYWTARIICIVAILMISMLALDSFSSEHSLWQNIAAFLIHLLPSFLLLSVLIIAWRHENAGGILMMIIGAVLSVRVFKINYGERHFTLMQSIINVSIVGLPFVVAGALFLISHHSKRRTSKLRLRHTQ
jgi:hypothetical protein